MPPATALASHRKRKRRRRQDKPAISARLVLDDHVKSDIGILSDDLFADLFPHLQDGKQDSFNFPFSIMLFVHVDSNPKLLRSCPGTSYNYRSVKRCRWERAVTDSVRCHCALDTQRQSPADQLDYCSHREVNRTCTLHPSVLPLLPRPTGFRGQPPANRPFETIRPQ